MVATPSLSVYYLLCVCSTIFNFYRRPSGTDKEFFVQLFVEPDKSMPMPTTERLLMKMFKEQKITFEKVCFAACLVYMKLLAF